MTDDLEGFGERLRTVRERLDMKQDRLADLIETDAGSISRWERGKGYPQTQQLVKLARTLGVSLDYLVLGEPGKTDVHPLPAAFNAFLQTEYGRIAQERKYVATLLSLRVPGEPSVELYAAIVHGLMLESLNSVKKPG